MNDTLGIIAVSLMVITYALEAKSPIFILLFSFSCALAAFYAYTIGSYPFLIAEGIWALIALKRYLNTKKPAN
ncbi:MAG: hypothetical protein AB8B49_04595 [Nitratireductor sp.]